MIFGWLRLYLAGAVVMTVVYGLLSIYARSLRREALEEEWETGDRTTDRATFVEAGMAEYRRSLRAKLILLVYVVPALAVPVIIYLLNFN